MNMKRYKADTMVNAMKKVRADFGEDAIILSSNVVKSKGFLGLFKKKSVEVVAGYDEPTPKRSEIIYEPVQEVKAESDSTTTALKKEMDEMKSMLMTMRPSTEHSRYPDELQALLAHLKKQELADELISEIADEIYDRMKKEKVDYPPEKQVEVVKEVLTNLMSDLPFGGITFKKKYINVLGPTGVGKTTTIAKIAARALLEKKCKVGFITTDTYRIAAIEQLRTYANLLQAPVEIVYNQEDFNKAIEKLAQLDLVFIDTAGRNYKEAKYVEDLSQLVDFTLDMESFLVLSMTSKEQDMKAIIEQFNAFPIEKMIYTKLDETSSIGPLFNLMKAYSMGTAYYTDGQEVPEDIAEASPEKLLALLMKDYKDA